VRFAQPVNRAGRLSTVVIMYPLADRLVAGPALWVSAVTLAAAVLLLARRAPAADRRADVRRGGAAVPVWLLDDAGG
jgi:hypothetical protein